MPKLARLLGLPHLQCICHVGHLMFHVLTAPFKLFSTVTGDLGGMLTAGRLTFVFYAFRVTEKYQDILSNKYGRKISKYMHIL